MAILTGTVLDKARDRHASFDEKRVPVRMARRFLSDYVRALHGKITAIDPEALRVQLLTNLPLANHDAGIALPANRYIASVMAIDPATSNPQQNYPIALLNAQTKDAWNAPVAAAWQIGDTLFLRSPASLWTGLGSIGIAYVPLPVELATAADVLPVPDAAELACVENLALFMARRGSMDSSAPPIDVGVFAQIAAAAEQTYLDDVINRLTGQVFLTRDVWPP